MIRSMDELRLGESARVDEVVGTSTVAIRILEMGFVPGTIIKLIKRAPFADPLEFQVRGAHVSLRAEEAKLVRVVTGE